MESCYIPNNPQYGLSLEYSTYTNGSSFNGTLTGFASGCNAIADGILCCRDGLQECSCDEFRKLKDFNNHCYSRCESEECNDSVTLEDRIALQHCEERFVECERIDSCDLVQCEGAAEEGRGHPLANGSGNHLVKCDDRIEDYDEHLTHTIDCLSDCDNPLIQNNGHLVRRDAATASLCGRQQLTGRDGEDKSRGDDPDDGAESTASAEERLIGYDRVLVSSKNYTGDYFEDSNISNRNSLDKLSDDDIRLRTCRPHCIISNALERLHDDEDDFHTAGACLNESSGELADCDREAAECDNQLLDEEQLHGNERLEFDEYRELESAGSGPGYWISDEMASCSFSLPPLDLDPLPSLFPFSPCSGNYKSELKEKQPNEVADVLLSLKHAVVHPGAELGAQYSQPELAIHPQVMMGSGGCYESCGSGVFPTMSVNVSMNMTMHGYPPEQVCSQMQWNQTPTSPLNVMYSQNQGVIAPSPYPGSATYSFTADFRGPTQSDPLITATSSFKPIQIAAGQKCPQGSNYNIFSQKSIQGSFSSFNQTHPPIKTRSAAKECPGLSGTPVVGSTYQLIGQSQNNLTPRDFGYAHVGNNNSALSSGKVQIGSLSGCSESEDEQKPNLCRICGKTYARPSTLKTHLRTHSGERPYRCSDCNKSFSQAANLTAHVRTHTGQKPFSCQICHRRFSQSSSVTTHMRTHSGERPYRCRACKKAFSDSSTLTKHLRIHSGEKPYQCKLCFLRFSQSGNLNRHMRVHGNNAALLG